MSLLSATRGFFKARTQSRTRSSRRHRDGARSSVRHRLRLLPDLGRLEDRFLLAAGVNYQQWQNLTNSWANGQANPNQTTWLEGDTVPYWSQETGLTVGQTYGIRVNLNYYQKNTNAGGFAYLDTYNTTINPPNDPGGSTSPPAADSTYTFTDPLSATDPHPTFFVQNADVLSVTYENNVTPTSPTPTADTDRYADIVFQANATTAEIYYGLTLALPGQNYPNATPPTFGTGAFTGGSLQTKIEGIPAAGTVPTEPTGGWITPSDALQLSPRALVEGRISGYKWNDLNSNGVLDGSETMLSGWTIDLYQDTNHDGIFEPGTDALYTTATTNASGNYIFSAATDPLHPVLRGTYFVQEVLQNGWTPTAPTATTTPPSAGTVNGVPYYEVVINQTTPTYSNIVFGNHPGADLAITKTDGTGSYVPGTSTTYTIVVTNGGPSNVTGATVTDPMPAAITSDSWTATATGGATGFAASGSGNISDTVNMPKGSTITYTVTANISSAATGNLVNTATVAVPAGVTDPTPGNNSQTDTDTASPKADLSITKTDGTTTYVPGTSTTYTIVVTNGGPSNVTGATVTDPMPAAITSDSWTATATGGATGFAASGSGNISDTVNMPKGSTITYTVTANISSAATGNLVNTATVAVPAGVTDPTPGNNSQTDTDTASPKADLSITKTDGTTTYMPGTSTTYTIVVTNSGPSNVTGATVTEPSMPAAITSDTWTATATGGATGFAASGSGNISDTVNMPKGSTITYTVTANISSAATGNLVNTATVAVPAGVTDPTPGNNSQTDTDTASPKADLSITKTDGTTTYVPGTSTTYTIVVTNSGPSNVTGATVTDPMPAAITSDSWTATATGGATGFAASGSGNISDTVNMPKGSTITYTVTANISSAATGNLVNTATVAVPAGVTDPTPGNNSQTDTDTASPKADLSITKTDGTQPTCRARAPLTRSWSATAAPATSRAPR